MRQAGQRRLFAGNLPAIFSISFNSIQFYKGVRKGYLNKSFNRYFLGVTFFTFGKSTFFLFEFFGKCFSKSFPSYFSVLFFQ